MSTSINLYTGITSKLWWLNILLALFVIFFGRKKPQSTVIWVMIMTFLPVVGFFFYLLLGQDYKKNKMFSMKKNQDKFIKNFVGFQEENIETGKFFENHPELEEYEQLLSMNLKSDEAFITKDNHVKFFFWGDDKYKNLFEDIKDAKSSIDVEYYIFKKDGLGERFLDLLTQKAKDGVKVRLLVDGYGGGKSLQPKDVKKFKQAEGKFCQFFPPTFGIKFLNFRLNYRNHRKIVVIDNKIAYVGGFNVGDEYLGLNKRMGNWRDTHLRIKGQAIYGLKIRFLKDWYYSTNEDASQNENGEEYIPLSGSEDYDVPMQIITSGPDTENTNIKNTMLKLFSMAKEEIIIQTPYFIVDEAITDALKIAILSGIKVKIMIPSKPDHPFIYWATTSWLGELIEAGAEVYIYDNGFLHAKVTMVDGLVSTVGSANMDLRSFSLNFEANAVIYDRHTNKQLKEQFENDLKQSRLLTKELYRNRSAIIKIKESFSRLLSPLL
ncbi:MAG: cardiolipin synthase [Tissierellia bacterium]|nr:cardiolipin synthase [Tissierellia bacterium]